MLKSFGIYCFISLAASSSAPNSSEYTEILRLELATQLASDEAVLTALSKQATPPKKLRRAVVAAKCNLVKDIIQEYLSGTLPEYGAQMKGFASSAFWSTPREGPRKYLGLAVLVERMEIISTSRYMFFVALRSVANECDLVRNRYTAFESHLVAAIRVADSVRSFLPQLKESARNALTSQEELQSVVSQTTPGLQGDAPTAAGSELADHTGEHSSQLDLVSVGVGAEEDQMLPAAELNGSQESPLENQAYQQSVVPQEEDLTSSKKDSSDADRSISTVVEFADEWDSLDDEASTGEFTADSEGKQSSLDNDATDMNNIEKEDILKLDTNFADDSSAMAAQEGQLADYVNWFFGMRSPKQPTTATQHKKIGPASSVSEEEEGWVDAVLEPVEDF